MYQVTSTSPSGFFVTTRHASLPLAAIEEHMRRLAGHTEIACSPTRFAPDVSEAACQLGLRRGLVTLPEDLD